MKLIKKEIKKHALIKWDYIYKNNGSEIGLSSAHPELAQFKAQCAYCSQYWHTASKMLRICFKCPLRPLVKDYDDLSDSGCCQIIHPYKIWRNNPNKGTAKAMRDLIKNS